MKKTVKIITGFLGVSMFMFGVLKFVDPFKSWYQAQVTFSHLPMQTLSYWAGQLGEMASGLAFLYLLVGYTKLADRPARWLFIGSHVSVIVMMAVAVYVHLQPEVPHEVLPLKIKPPVIPFFFMGLATVNLYLHKSVT